MDEGLLGWRTRLVQRAQDQQGSRPPQQPAAAQSVITPNERLPLDLGIGMGTGGTDQLVSGRAGWTLIHQLHQFWDPMLAQNSSDTSDIGMVSP